MRARLKNFDAVCQMVEASAGVAIIPEAAARYSRSAKIKAVRMTDPWTNRTLVISMRNRRSLPRPVQQFADHLEMFAKI